MYQKPLRYILYVHKSSEDAKAQVKSLPDQITACKEYAKAKGLLVVGEPGGTRLLLRKSLPFLLAR